MIERGWDAARTRRAHRFQVVDADSSQQQAIRAAKRGRSIVIEGPPGTGKSQTIANLLADYAARGRKVLFVCEKRVALDVVYHRLADAGLAELSFALLSRIGSVDLEVIDISNRSAHKCCSGGAIGNARGN